MQKTGQTWIPKHRFVSPYVPASPEQQRRFSSTVSVVARCSTAQWMLAQISLVEVVVAPVLHKALRDGEAHVSGCHQSPRANTRNVGREHMVGA